MAPLEYTLTITVPRGSSTKPVDCRYSGSSLTNAPVRAATARASALCPSGKVRPCLAVNCAVVFSSSTHSAAIPVPGWFAGEFGILLERAQLRGAVGAPRSAVDQQDSELAGEPAGNRDGRGAGNGEGQRGERVARVQQGHGLPPYRCRRVTLTASSKRVPARAGEAAVTGGSASTPPAPGRPA